MSKTARNALIVLGLLAAVVAIVLLLVVRNLDDIIHQAVEKVGSRAMGTEVTLDDVSFTLAEGRGELYGLRIANPPGFDSRYVFELDKVAVQVEVASITGEVIVIEEATVAGARLLAQQKGLKTNLTKMMNDIKAASSNAGAQPDQASAGDEPRLMLVAFNFTDVETTLATESWGDHAVSLPPIHLRNIGDRETGLTPQQLANRMSRQLLKQTEKAVAAHLEKLGKDAAKKELDKQLDKNLSDKDKAQLEKAKSLFGK